MQSQLVLKFRRPVLDTAGVAILEGDLRDSLGDSVELDGHNEGVRDIDLFIITEDPASTFRRCKPVLEKLQLLDRVVAAHRFVGGLQFKVIWPLRWGRKFSVS
jgi:hypothetical protein